MRVEEFHRESMREARMRMQMKQTTTHRGNDQAGKLLQKCTGIWSSVNTGALETQQLGPDMSSIHVS